MKILITGANGFIGFHLIQLLNEAFDVKGLDFDLTENIDPVKEHRKSFLLQKGLPISKIDIRDKQKLENFISDFSPDTIVHLAACTGISASEINRDLYFEVNVSGFHNILESCIINNIKNIIYASSSSVYNNNSEIFLENNVSDNQLSFYGYTKRLNEHMADNFSKRYDINIIGLRFFTVYGSYVRTDMAAWNFLNSLMGNKPITLYNQGNVYRDFTHVSDIVKSIELIVKKDKTNNLGHQLFNIGNGKPALISDYLNEMAICLDKKPNIIYKPLPANELQYTHASTEKLYSFIGYKPKTSLQEGVREMVDWFLKSKY